MSAFWRIVLLMLTPLQTSTAPATPYFTITVLDDQTGRGVPLVELSTVNNIRCYTDSNGVVAFYEPGLMGQETFFFVKSHGYEFPADGFGFRGLRLRATGGGSAEIKIKRLNIAERLYRVTGGGIYRDSVLAERPVPIEQPLLSGQVLGQDSVLNTLYKGQLYWFWGDTSRPAYPLGNFQVTGATSRLPGEGGLAPDVGVNLTYFVDETGFAKQMAPLPGPGPNWIDGLITLRDASGTEHLFADYAKVRQDMSAWQRGLLEFDDAAQQFKKIAEYDLKAPILPGGHPFIYSVNGLEYVYYARPFPVMRVRADAKALPDLSNYEAYTCLKDGCRADKPELDRDEHGVLRYGWKHNTAPLDLQEQEKLLKTGRLKPEEAPFRLYDIATGKPVLAHGGSVYWNEYRQRWVMIVLESFGTSFLGEVWFAEADTPLGPWLYARKIVTHDKYSFYNPKQHALFAQDRGRLVYFEGTYATTFSGNTDPTPRYDYNQIMYRLDLSDPRVVLPVPIYALDGGAAPSRFGTKTDLRGDVAEPPLAFLALDRPVPDCIAVYQRTKADGTLALEAGPASASGSTDAERPVFCALSVDVKEPPVATALLYEFAHQDGAQRTYFIDTGVVPPGYRRAEHPLCRVWRNPRTVIPAASPTSAP